MATNKVVSLAFTVFVFVNFLNCSCTWKSAYKCSETGITVDAIKNFFSIQNKHIIWWNIFRKKFSTFSLFVFKRVWLSWDIHASFTDFRFSWFLRLVNSRSAWKYIFTLNLMNSFGIDYHTFSLLLVQLNMTEFPRNFLILFGKIA